MIDYEDREIAKLLRFGAQISHESGIIEARETTHKNHSVARLFPEDIDKYIKKEQKYKSILGPFISNSFSSHIQLSPLDSKPKDDSEQRRVIVDLSFPKGSSVNSGISKDHYLGESMRCEFPKVDHLVDLIRLKGQGCALFKRYLKRAYHQLLVCPGDYNLLRRFQFERPHGWVGGGGGGGEGRLLKMC